VSSISLISRNEGRGYNVFHVLAHAYISTCPDTKTIIPLIHLCNPSISIYISYPVPIEVADLGKAKAVFQVNVLGVIDMVQHFGPYLRRNRGRVVNIGSATGTLAIQSGVSM